MSTNAKAMIKAGVDAYKTGDKAKARQMLEKAIEVDPYSEMAWLWLSAIVESKEEQQTCLTNVLVINPESDRARQGLKSLGIDPDSVLAEEEAEEELVEEDDDYFVPTSSSSSSVEIEETPAEEYDDWMDNLGIGEEAATSSQDDIFGADDFSSSDAGFDFGEDLFSEDSFDSGFDSGFDDGGDFGDEYADGEYEDYGDDAYEYDDVYDDEYDYEAEGDFVEGEHYSDSINAMDDLYADIGTLEEFDGVLDEDIHDYDMDEFAGDPFAEPELEDEEPAGPTIDQLFAQIPSEIEPTRLPGTDEETPQSAYIPIAILGVLNVIAVIFIIFQIL